MARLRPKQFIPFALVVLFAAMVIFPSQTYHRDITQARARISTGSQIATTPCGPMEYAVTGEGPPLLVVHGAGGGFDQGLEMGREIAARGFRVIAVSRFGYLRTPMPQDASAAAQADAHACLLDALRIPRAAILGFSAGAPSSLQFALRHPDRCAALVLLVPVAYAPRDEGPAPPSSPLLPYIFDTALRFDFLFWLAEKAAHDTVVQALLATKPALVDAAPPEEQARVQRVLDHIQPVSLRRAGLLNDAEIAADPPRYPLEKIAAPALALSVEDDLFGTYENARYTAAHIPGARFVGFAQGGHLWVGHHTQVIDTVSAFLKATVIP